LSYNGNSGEIEKMLTQDELFWLFEGILIGIVIGFIIGVKI
jgi:hypothetical protein